MRLVSELGAKPVKTSDGQPGRATANESTDAMFAPLDDAAASKASKGFTTAYDIQASFPLSVVVINQSAYYTLGEEVQRALLNAAVTAQNAAWADSIDERNASVDLLAKENLTVQAPPQALVTELKNASNPLIKSWLAAAGNDGHTILSASDSATR
jgi:TRAP-type C4-dicarboxylate transport system substrate-binding protein